MKHSKYPRACTITGLLKGNKDHRMNGNPVLRTQRAGVFKESQAGGSRGCAPELQPSSPAGDEGVEPLRCRAFLPAQEMCHLGTAEREIVGEESTGSPSGEASGERTGCLGGTGCGGPAQCQHGAGRPHRGHHLVQPPGLFPNSYAGHDPPCAAPPVPAAEVPAASRGASAAVTTGTPAGAAGTAWLALRALLSLPAACLSSRVPHNYSSA